MKGNNTLELNQATMVEALQLWADATFKSPPKIVAVKQSSSGNYTASCFTVELSEAEPKSE